MNVVEKTKDADGENFPVGSVLIAKELRPCVMAFYDFARTADDIADASNLSSDEKLKRLDALEAVLEARQDSDDLTKCAEVLRISLFKQNITNQHAKDLLKAFRQDSMDQYTYHSWEDVMAYCRHSAGSVGRFMLDLHQEGPSTYWPSDAVCAALQLNNHLQDCKKDYLSLKRVYLPKQWMDEHNVTNDDLIKEQTSPSLQLVFDRMINGIEGLLIEGSSLPLVMTNTRFRMEVCVIFRLAQRLVKRLKKNDILSHHVELKKIDWLFALIRGCIGGLQRKKIKCLSKKDIKPKN